MGNDGMVRDRMGQIENDDIARDRMGQIENDDIAQDGIEQIENDGMVRDRIEQRKGFRAEDIEGRHPEDIKGQRSGEIGYFPMFIDLWKKKIVVVGAGEIAKRRIGTLLLFGADILVVAPMTSVEAISLAEVLEAKGIVIYVEGQEPFRIEKNPEYADRGQVTILCKPYEVSVCENAFMVLAATDNEELNAQIYRDAKAAGAFANNASDHHQCDFYFPSVVKQGDHVVGINGGGQDHKGTKRLRQRIEKVMDIN